MIIYIWPIKFLIKTFVIKYSENKCLCNQKAQPLLLNLLKPLMPERTKFFGPDNTLDPLCRPFSLYIIQP